MRRSTPRQRESGQSLVEFTLILPVIIVIVFGVLDLGRGVFAYNTLAQAARQANRTAMVDQDVDRVRAAAIAAAPSLGLTAGNVSVCFKTDESVQTDCSSLATDDCPEATRVMGCLAIVTTSLTYVPMTPVLGSIIGSVQLRSTSIQPIEYVCPYALHRICP